MQLHVAEKNTTIKLISYFSLQLIGFTILLIGMACYNNIVIPQLVRKCRCRIGRHTSSTNEDHIINTAADDVQETI
jgi:hypothetical protein